MDSCSICLHSLTGVIYRFEQCSTHIFCFSCFTNKNLIEDLKCIDCNQVLNVPFFKNFSESCFYCQTQSVLLNCENNHKLCSDCVEKKEIGVECYYCYIRIFTYCSTCRVPLTLKTPIPEHPCHSKCSECFRMRTQNTDCLDCVGKTSGIRNACYLCQKRSIVKELCERHGLCIQCCIILQMFKADNYKQIDCNQCITRFNFIDFSNVCSICGVYDKDSIPIIACLKNHICCLKCFKGKPLIKNLACRDCRIYFRLKEINKINCCVICYYDSSLVFKRMCRSHYICAKCSEKIFKLSHEKQQKLINCQDCLHFNYQEYEIVSKNAKNYEACFLCNENSGIEIGCLLHKFCKKCLMFKMNYILEKIGYCPNCNNFNSKVCRMCLNVTEKPLSLKCSYEHIYCLSCIKQKTKFIENDNEICSECRDIVFNDRYMQNQRCIQCRIPMNPSSNCSEHSICSDCLLNTTDEVNQTFLNCKKCKEYLQNKCNRCKNSSSNYFCLIECKAQHFYCEPCFGTLKIYLDINCGDCSVAFNKKGPIKITKFCSKCMSIEIAQFICNTHSYCLKCSGNSENYAINNCTNCSELFEKYCFNCLNELTDKNKLFFPTCDKNHFYCILCFNNVYTTGTFKCRACKDKIKNYYGGCDLCFRREATSKLCPNHSFCGICMTNLKKEVGIYLKCLLDCSLCRKIIENSGPIEMPQPVFNSHNQAPLPIKKSPVTESDIYRQNHPKLENSKGKYYNPPINQGSVYNYDKISAQQNHNSPNINSSEIQKEGGNNWILKKMSEHKEVVKQSITPQQENPIFFHNPANQLIFFDPSQPVPSTNTDFNSHLEGSSNINNLNSAGLTTNLNTGYEFIANQAALKSDNNLYEPQQFPIKKKHEVLCKICKIKYPRLKCNHPKCPECLYRAFFKKFNLFIAAFNSQNIKSLKSIDYSISCPVPNCSNKNCFPFDLYISYACSILEPHFPNDPVTAQRFVLHYEGFFEGIEYTFMICHCCKKFTGKASHQLCLWCNN